MAFQNTLSMVRIGHDPEPSVYESNGNDNLGHQFGTRSFNALFIDTLSFKKMNYLKLLSGPDQRSHRFPRRRVVAEAEEGSRFGDALWLLNRNARAPKKANHGARPCSHVGRKAKRQRKGVDTVYKRAYKNGIL